MTRKYRGLILMVFATLTLALTTSGFSSSLLQGAGKVSMNDISFVHITANGIGSLPPGENRIVRETDNRSTTYVGTANGGVWKVTNGGSSVDLMKIGAGTLTLPYANSYSGFPKVGGGVLQNSAKLILADPLDVVYEFSNVGASRFSQIFIPAGSNSGAPVIEIKTRVQQDRPAGAMKGWPFSRLLVGTAAGIARVEGWKAGKGSTPYVCTSGRCQCSGSSDCLGLAASNSCTSQMNCDGAGNSVKCYCSTR